MTSILELKNISVGFQGKKILENLNGSIRPGELVALMGVNGVGKSCLLKSLLGIHPLMNGDIIIEQKNMKHYRPQDLALKVAAVLTDKPQMDFLQVGELVSLGRSPHTNFWGEINQVDRDIIDSALHTLNITHLKNLLFDQLSGGQKQKVLLARALAQKPELLILDEPTTYLDIPSKIELMNVLKKISADMNLAILMSTHDLNLVEKVVDTIWLIEKEGNLIIKSPEEMKSSGHYRKNFNI